MNEEKHRKPWVPQSKDPNPFGGQRRQHVKANILEVWSMNRFVRSHIQEIVLDFVPRGSSVLGGEGRVVCRTDTLMPHGIIGL